MKAADRISSALADRVYVEYDSISSLVVSQRICPPEKIKVLSAWSLNSLTSGFLCLDDAKGLKVQIRGMLRVPDDAVVLGYVGRIVRDKGIEELVQSFVRLAIEHAHVYLLLVGPRESVDPVSAETKALIENHPRIRSVEFQTDERTFFCAMDILVHPSYREGLASSPLEGAAVQLPVITTRVPGCVDTVVNQATGILVEPRNLTGLLEGMRMYLADKEKRIEHGIDGRKRILKEHDPALSWERLREDYVALVECKKNRTKQ
jgi:glycosyltransferase involved in cell wall biosynthesis